MKYQGMILLFFRKKKTEEQRKAEDMPYRLRVQFQDMDMKELIKELDRSGRNIYSLPLINEKALKYRYLNCTFYYRSEDDDVYYSIDKMNDDRVKASTPFYRIDYGMMREIVAKTGRRI